MSESTPKPPNNQLPTMSINERMLKAIGDLSATTVVLVILAALVWWLTFKQDAILDRIATSHELNAKHHGERVEADQRLITAIERIATVLERQQ